MSFKSSFQRKAPGVLNVYHFLWAWAGAQFHKDPSRRMFVIGVTGTKGKTTTLELLNSILEAAGKQTALLSSLRVKVADETWKNNTGNSMPGRGYIQKFLRRARVMRCGYALIEVTSQGAVLHRHRFIHWNMGVLTNLHPEHIESHGSFENYRNAKLGFLKYVFKSGGKVFLNRDDGNFDFFAKALGTGETVSYSKDDEKLSDYMPSPTPMREGTGEEVPKFLLSNFNQENIAAAVAIARELGIGDRVIKEALADFSGVPGRMEFVTAGSYTAVVDYAHTPESLEAAYKALRDRIGPETRDFDDHDAPRLICVLGAAGGGRDTWKRPEMGKIAAHYCDEIILTDEDPYEENPASIIEEVDSGINAMPYPKPTPIKILDRKEALTKAIDMMNEGDIVIATGKGSEDWIHLPHGRKIAWNEKMIVQDLLSAKENNKMARAT